MIKRMGRSILSKFGRNKTIEKEDACHQALIEKVSMNSNEVRDNVVCKLLNIDSLSCFLSLSEDDLDASRSAFRKKIENSKDILCDQIELVLSIIIEKHISEITEDSERIILYVDDNYTREENIEVSGVLIGHAGKVVTEDIDAFKSNKFSILAGTAEQCSRFLQSSVGRASAIPAIVITKAGDAVKDLVSANKVRAQKAKIYAKRDGENDKFYYSNLLVSKEVQHEVVQVSTDTVSKGCYLADLFKSYKELTLIFTSHASDADFIEKYLSKTNVRCVKVIGNSNSRFIDKLRSDVQGGLLDVVITTDIAAKNIEVSEFKLIVNYGLPRDKTLYLERTMHAERVLNVINSLDVAVLEQLRSCGVQFVPSREKVVPQLEEEFELLKYVPILTQNEFSYHRNAMLAKHILDKSEEEKFSILTCLLQERDNLSFCRASTWFSNNALMNRANGQTVLTEEINVAERVTEEEEIVTRFCAELNDGSINDQALSVLCDTIGLSRERLSCRGHYVFFDLRHEAEAATLEKFSELEKKCVGWTISRVLKVSVPALQYAS